MNSFAVAWTFRKEQTKSGMSPLALAIISPSAKTCHNSPLGDASQMAAATRLMPQSDSSGNVIRAALSVISLPVIIHFHPATNPTRRRGKTDLG